MRETRRPALRYRGDGVLALGPQHERHGAAPRAGRAVRPHGAPRHARAPWRRGLRLAVHVLLLAHAVARGDGDDTQLHLAPVRRAALHLARARAAAPRPLACVALGFVGAVLLLRPTLTPEQVFPARRLASGALSRLRTGTCASWCAHRSPRSASSSTSRRSAPRVRWCGCCRTAGTRSRSTPPRSWPALASSAPRPARDDACLRQGAGTGDRGALLQRHLFSSVLASRSSPTRCRGSRARHRADRRAGIIAVRLQPQTRADPPAVRND